MKKILTILAASAMFFAFGEDISNGINFENYTGTGEGSFDPIDGDAVSGGALTGGQYWYSASSAGNVISNHVAAPTLPQGVTVPDLFKDDNTNTNFLYLETEAPLFRTVKTNSHDPATFEGVSITESPIYLDTLVKFTAADSAFTSLEDAADKIAIEYVEHEEESHEDQTTGETVIDSYGFTNFVIRAGFIASSTALVATNYVVALPDGWLENNKKDAWHRLTVRTLTNIDGHDRVGFKIYLDETPMVYITDDAPKYADFAKGAGIDDDTHTIFPSAVETDKNNYNEISAVAFSGNGSIDDVVFTTTMPDFIKSSEEVVAKVIADSGVAGISVQVGAVTNVVVDMTASSLTATLPAGTPAFTVTVTLDPNGYTFDDMVYGGVSYSNGDEITYNGGDIVITTTRNNFNLFNASGDPISGTYQTLGAALAATGVAKIQLAHDYNVVEGDIPNGYIDIDRSTTLDLNGKTLDGGDSVVSPLFMVNDGNFVIIDSVGGGKVVYDGPGIVYGASSYIGAVSGDLGPTFDGQLFFEGGDGYVIRANVLAEGNTNEGAFLWTLGDGGDIDSEANLVGDYWVVTPQGGSEPTEIPVPTAVTGLAYNGTVQTGVVEAVGFTLTGNTGTNAGGYQATATLASGYAWVGGSTEPTNIYWSITYKQITPTIVLDPASATLDANKTTVGDYTTVKVYDGETQLTLGTDYVVNYLDTAVSEAGEYTIEVAPVAPIGNYKVNATTATLTITASGGYPTYIDTTDDTIKGKYDAWAQTYGADTGSAYEAAFLLNVDPDTGDTTLDATNIVISGTTVTITIDHEGVNGYPYVLQAATLDGLKTATPTPATIGAGGVITLTSSAAAQFFKVGVSATPIAVP